MAINQQNIVWDDEPGGSISTLTPKVPIQPKTENIVWDDEPGESGILDYVGGAAKSIGKQALRFGPNLARTLDQGIGFAGGLLESGAKTAKESTGDFLGMFSPYEKIGKAVKEYGLSAAKDVKKALEHPFFSLPKEKQKRLWDNPQYLLDPEWLAYNAGDAIQSLGLVVAGGMAAGPAGAIAVGGGMEGLDLYDELIESGADQDKSASASIAFGIVTGILNKIGADKVMSKLTGNILKRSAKRLASGSVEAATEWAEEPFQAAFGELAKGKSIGDATKSAYEAMKNVDVIPGAFLAGGAMSSRGTPAAEAIPAPTYDTQAILQTIKADLDSGKLTPDILVNQIKPKLPPEIGTQIDALVASMQKPTVDEAMGLRGWVKPEEEAVAPAPTVETIPETESALERLRIALAEKKGRLEEEVPEYDREAEGRLLRGERGGEEPGGPVPGRGIGEEEIGAGGILQTPARQAGEREGGVEKPLIFAVRDKDGNVISDPKATTHAQVILDQDANPDDIVDSGFIFKGEYKPGNPVRDEKGNIIDIEPLRPMPDWMKETPEGKKILSEKGFTGITEEENRKLELARAKFEKAPESTITPGTPHGIPVKVAESALGPIRKALPNAPELVVIKDPQSIPAEVLKGDVIRTLDENTKGRIRGIFSVVKGKPTIYLVAFNFNSREDLFKTAIHEIVGHQGIRSTLQGKAYTNFLNNLYDAKETSPLMQDILSNYGFDVATPEGRQKASDEWFARTVVDNGYKDTSIRKWWNQFVAIFRDWTRRVGFRLRLTDAEIADVINRAWARMEGERLGRGVREGQAADLTKKEEGRIPAETTPKAEGGILLTELWVSAEKKGDYTLQIPGEKLQTFKNLEDLKKATPSGFEVPDNLAVSWVGSDTRRLTNQKNIELKNQLIDSEKKVSYIKAARERDDFQFITNDDFIKKFEGSDVVDEKNLPLKTYHSTSSDFKEFSLKSIRHVIRGGDTVGADRTGQMGFWFSSDPNIVETYGGTKTIEAYLNIKRPKWYTRLNDLADELETKSASKLKKELESQGYDGIGIRYPKGETSKYEEYVAFYPNQIITKPSPNLTRPPESGGPTALDIAPSFADQYVKDLLAAKKAGNPFGGGPLRTNTDKARETLLPHFNNFMYWIVDKNRPIQSIQSKLKNVSEDIDLFLSETQRPKITAAKIKEAWDDKIKPLLQKMADSKIQIADAEEYAHAVHIKNDNANELLRLANSMRYYEEGRKLLSKEEKLKLTNLVKEKIGFDTIDELVKPEQYNQALKMLFDEYGENKDIAKLKDDWDIFSEKLAGMTDAEADTILKINAGNKNIEEVRLMILAINNERLDILRDSGILPDEEYNAYKKKYKFYVPLKREGFDDKAGSTGRGLQPAGRAVKTRMGSTRNVVNIIANTVSNYETAINRAEKASSARAFLELIKANPDIDLWTVKEVKKTPRYDDEGNIRLYPNIFDVSSNEIRIMVDGNQYLIEINRGNKDAMLMLKTLKAKDNMGGPLVNALSKLNRWLARINTSWSPEFILTNPVRDIQTAGINVQDTGVESKKILRGAIESVRAIYNVERGKRKGTDLEAMYDRFKNAGGKIGWSDVHGSVEKLANKISKELGMMSGERPISKTVSEWIGFIEDVNTAMENGVRLHVFQLAVEQGMTDKKAAQIASDLTVDFTKKGAAGPVINSLYLFAGAGIQGSYRIIRAGAKSPKVRKIMGGIVGVGFLAGLLNSAIGGKDDDDEDYYNKIDDFVRERNMIFMLPGTEGKYVKIPMPWGYNFFFNLGDELSKIFTTKRYKPWDGVCRLATVFVGAFNPIQSGTLLQTLSPTITDPFAQVAENKNWFGGDLMPAENKFAQVPTPDSERYWKSVSAPSKWVASQLNWLTGGSKVRSGYIDVSPETLDLILDSAGGSMLRFVKDTVGTPITLISQEELQLQKIPFVRRIVGEKSEWSDSKLYRENITEILTAKEELEAYRNTDYYDTLRENLQVQRRLIPMAEDYEKQLRELRKRRNRYEINGMKEQAKNIDERINEKYRRFNKLVNEKR